MSIRAGVTKTYKRDFVLDPTMLGSIVDVINEATAKMSRSTTTLFSVYRQDDSFYRTEELAEVLSDDNTSAKAIKSLVIQLIYGDGTSTKDEDIVLVLSCRRFQDEKIVLIVDSDEREWSFRLAEQLDTKIGRLLGRPRLPLQQTGLIDWLAIAAIMVIVLVIYNWTTMSWSEAPDLLTTESLSSLTLEEKFDTFMLALQQRLAVTRSQYIYIWPLAIVFWGVVLAMITAKPISRFLEKYSRSAFYWGDAIRAYDRARTMESRVIWSVLGALLITIVGGLIVANIT